MASKFSVGAGDGAARGFVASETGRREKSCAAAGGCEPTGPIRRSGCGLGVSRSLGCDLRALDRFDDADIAGAAAEIAGQFQADALFVGVRQPRDDVPRRHQHAGRAEAALQAVILGEGFAQQRHHRIVFEPSSVVISAPFAAAAKVMQDRAGAPSISTVQAPHTPCSQPICVAGQRLMLAQEIGEVQPRLDLRLHAAAVDGEARVLSRRGSPVWPRASSATSARLRIYSSLTFFPSRSCNTAGSIQASAMSGPNLPPNSALRVGNDDRRGLDGADHGAEQRRAPDRAARRRWRGRIRRPSG